MGRHTADEAEEFWRRVNKNGPVHPKLKTRCWLWTGATRAGYGRFTILGKYHAAHVRSLEMAKGPLLEGEKVLHRCDNQTCVRPGHLFKGTQHENILDAVKKGRHKNPVMRGEKHPLAVITRADVDALRASPPTREQRAERARSLGITKSSMMRILRGERWKD